MDAHLHEKAKALKPKQEIKPTRFWVGVLYPDRKPSELLQEADFLWIKAHGKITVQTIREQFLTKVPVEIVLKLGESTPSDETKLAELNHYGDNVVIFRAVEASSSAARSHRTPLAPTNVQTTVSTPERAAALSKSPQSTKLEAFHGLPLPHGAFTDNATPRGKPNTPRQESVSTESGRRYGSAMSFITEQDENRAPQLDDIDPHAPMAVGHGMQSRAPTLDPKHGYTEHWSEQRPMKQEESTSSLSSLSHDTDMKDEPDHSQSRAETPEPLNLNLQSLMTENNPDILEKGVAKGIQLLDNLQSTFSDQAQGRDSQQWLQQIEVLRKEAVLKRTVIGVVGNTGAGKSSVINALLDEERLVPTNCMRACTAVVTEMSWNDSEDEESRYRGVIEFIQAADWAKELQILFNDIIDANGKVSSEVYNADSEAGVAYAKIRAVYPKLGREELAQSSVESLMKDPAVQAVLGATREVDESDPETFYRRLQHYVDSKEKVTTDKKSKKKEPKQIEYWPLIKVVKIYTKAEALSTGAVVVDLPGVHDSNAARAAVAEGYMKQCSGLWIVAPITRAVDDKAAKSLLGESFKRQLKYDGTYSDVTFICSKTDDISITEAADSLGLDGDLEEAFRKMDDITTATSRLKNELRDLRESRSVYESTMDDLADQQEVWETFKDDVSSGKTVYAPSIGTKRKRGSESPQRAHKKSRLLTEGDDTENNSTDDNDDEMVVDVDADEEDKGEPLTMEAIEAKIEGLRKTRREARRQKDELAERIRDVNSKIAKHDESLAVIEAEISAVCIAGRNQYSKGAIQQDFAAGIKELDQENAAEEDEANFNPEEDLRDYEEVARSLPVFCVSSRAYQKLCGRMVKDQPVAGFTKKEETEIPQLQAHCKKLTESGRALSCRRFLNGLSQLMTSLSLWASSAGLATHLSDAHRRSEAKFMLGELRKLEKSFGEQLRECLTNMRKALEEHVYERYDTAIQLGAEAAVPTAQKWGSPVDRNDRAAGGLYWATYKAVCRRNGVFANANGLHDFNLQLAEPMIKYLAQGWERAFVRRLPLVFKGFAKASSAALKSFHESVETHARSNGVVIAGFAMLSQQLRNYELAFVDLSEKTTEQINSLQRDANREFTPTLAHAMSDAYSWCTAESGPGQFMRMKQFMTSHVQAYKQSMFDLATTHVKGLLDAMCRQVEQNMEAQTAAVVASLRRDYLGLITGASKQGNVVSGADEILRQDIAAIVKEADEAFREVVEGPNLRSEAAGDRADDHSSIGPNEYGCYTVDVGFDELLSVSHYDPQAPDVVKGANPTFPDFKEPQGPSVDDKGTPETEADIPALVKYETPPALMDAEQLS